MSVSRRYPVVGRASLPVGESRNLDKNIITTTRLRTQILDLPTASESWGTDADVQPLGVDNEAGQLDLFSRADHVHAGLASVNGTTGAMTIVSGTDDGVHVTTAGSVITLNWGLANATVYWNPVAGSDAHDGLTAGTPVATLASVKDVARTLKRHEILTIQLAGVPFSMEATGPWDFRDLQTNARQLIIRGTRATITTFAVTSLVTTPERPAVCTLATTGASVPINSYADMFASFSTVPDASAVLLGNNTLSAVYAVAAPVSTDPIVAVWEPSTVVAPAHESAGDTLCPFTLLSNVPLVLQDLDLDIRPPVGSGVAGCKIVGQQSATRPGLSFINVRFTEPNLSAGSVTTTSLNFPVDTTFTNCIMAPATLLAPDSFQTSTSATVDRLGGQLAWIMDGCLVRTQQWNLSGIVARSTVIGGPQASGTYAVDLPTAVPTALFRAALGSGAVPSLPPSLVLTGVLVWCIIFFSQCVSVVGNHVGFANSVLSTIEADARIAQPYFRQTDTAMIIRGGFSFLVNLGGGSVPAVGDVNRLITASSGANVRLQLARSTSGDAVYAMKSYGTLSEGTTAHISDLRGWVSTVATAEDYLLVSEGSSATIDHTSLGVPSPLVVSNTTGKCFNVLSGGSLTLKLSGVKPATALGSQLFVGALGAVAYPVSPGLGVNDYATANTQVCRVAYVS